MTEARQENNLVKKTKCFLSADGLSFTIKMNEWSDLRPIASLGEQIAFYEGLRDRKDGQFAKHYVRTVDALKSLKERIAENT